MQSENSQNAQSNHDQAKQSDDDTDRVDNCSENIDWAEVNKFEALAERWWDENGEFRPLHQINPLRMHYLEQRSGFSLKGKRIIDVGCGGGILAESMANKGAKVTGIDAGEANISVAKIHGTSVDSTVEYIKTTAEVYAEQHAGQFDIVTCMEMLEHVPDPALVINACASMLKPGGMAFFSTINRTPKAYLFAIIGAEYVLNILPKGTHDYAKFLKPDEIDVAAGDSGLHIEHAIGMHYNPITKAYWLAKGLSVNYTVCYRKPIDASASL